MCSICSRIVSWKFGFIAFGRSIMWTINCYKRVENTFLVERWFSLFSWIICSRCAGLSLWNVKCQTILIKNTTNPACPFTKFILQKVPLNQSIFSAKGLVGSSTWSFINFFSSLEWFHPTDSALIRNPLFCRTIRINAATSRCSLEILQWVSASKKKCSKWKYQFHLPLNL